MNDPAPDFSEDQRKTVTGLIFMHKIKVKANMEKEISGYVTTTVIGIALSFGQMQIGIR